MHWLKQLLNFYINSSIHVALSVFSLTWISLLEYGILFDKSLLLFVFFASISGYNFVKYFGLAKFHHRNLANWLKTIQVFSFMCFFFMCYYLFQLHINTLFFIGGLGLVTFFYAIPFLPKHLYLDSKHNLRSIGGLKVYLIALVWAGVTVLLPVINNEFPVNMDVVIAIIQRFIFIIALMLPFEIRDLIYDSLKLATIPQKIGMKQTKRMGVVLLLLFFFLEFFKKEVTLRNIFVAILIALVTSLFVIYADKEQSKYYSSFWVEGIPVLWLIVLLMFS
ncbi:hypothetical protein QLS71_010085 [Mariniflexile litorale]|uniref:Prenyltransferase n=1 Tax=Mariniflexile litorale TaxID=3045158 RepID=A0AAU7EAN7_9FLAO|nr:hypothetical protein [Mariniflexile sp. KMM 9835]MDQ8213424.1 hypothetical protein [Mariniflexile sp. KMM 9835]